MCGIAGQLNKNTPVEINGFKRMLNTLERRGPDGYGIKALENGKVYLGHRRLSIIDLSVNASQPMTNEDGTLWLTFNGEIYNYKSLRTTLQARGHVFRTQSDSEVILHGFEEWGKDCVKKFRGIFAFAVYDTKTHSAFLARDHAGVKPLYYYHNDSVFAFASEPKAIIAMDGFRKEVDDTAFQLYLTYGNVPGEHCIYKGVKKLLPGHYLVVENAEVKNVQQYWKLTYNPVIHDEEKAIKAVREKIAESIELQSVSDVPVGVLLSGGIDSTIVTGHLSKILHGNLSTFTIGFDDSSYDESRFAHLIASSYSTNHYSELIDSKKAMGFINRIVDVSDEPFHFTGLFSYFAVSNLVTNTGYKVVMGGDGADELFAGYNWYSRISRLQAKQSPSKKDLLMKILGLNRFSPSANYLFRQFAVCNSYLSPELHKNLTGKYNDDTILSVIKKHWNYNLPPVLAAQIADFNCFQVDHCLTKVDRMSMAQGVEVRVPLLDVELAELAFSIEHNIVYTESERKALLKKAGAEYFPAEMDTKRKKGFSSPVEKWMQELSKKAKLHLLHNGSLISRHLIDGNWLTKNFGVLVPKDQLLLIALELWAKRWIENEKPTMPDS